MPLDACELSSGGPAVTSAGGFSSLEWLVISSGTRSDSVPLQWSRFGHSMRSLLVDRHDLRDQRLCALETLRRMAALARVHGWHLPACEIGLFLSAGWTEAQLECLVESVTDGAPVAAAGRAMPSHFASRPDNADPAPSSVNAPPLRPPSLHGGRHRQPGVQSGAARETGL